MRLVYSFNCYQHTEALLKRCRISKDLYNQALHVCLVALKQDTPKYLNYYDLVKILPNTPNLERRINYRLLKAQCSQQTLKCLASAIKGFFKSIKDWKANPNKYTGMPKLPRYLPKNGYYPLIYTNQNCTIKDRFIKLEKDIRIEIPMYEKYAERLGHFQQVRILPRQGFCKVEIIYEYTQDSNDLDYSRYAGIDLGLTNIATMVTDFHNPILYSGTRVKACNQWFNKALASAKSLLDTNNHRKSSHYIQRIYTHRNNQMDDTMHKISRHVVNLLVKNNVGTLVCGRNKGWKDSIDLGRRNNQQFVQVPHERLISMLKYKCEMAGIHFIETEEAYTSKCDALAREPIGKHDSYQGSRIRRGLFQSGVGKLVNADVNGALNIMRKVFRDSEDCMARILDSGRLFLPRKLFV